MCEEIERVLRLASHRALDVTLRRGAQHEGYLHPKGLF